MINIVVHSNGEVLTGDYGGKIMSSYTHYPFILTSRRRTISLLCWWIHFQKGCLKHCSSCVSNCIHWHSNQTDCCILREICERIGQSSSILWHGRGRRPGVGIGLCSFGRHGICWGKECFENLGFMSKFVLLKALGLVVNCPGQAVPRKMSCPEYFGTALKVIFFFTYLLYCFIDSF
jgi:hypothetical protein